MRAGSLRLIGPDIKINVSEPMPPNAPEYRGKKVSMTCFVDALHGNCQVTRRSWTGVMIFVNRV